MNEEQVQSPGIEPVEEEDVGQNTEKTTSEAENTTEVATAQEDLASSDTADAEETPKSDPVETALEDTKEEAKSTGGDPPVDWFEPLEEDDDFNSTNNDPEEESLAGESERSESVAGSEKAFKKIYQ